MLHFSLVLSFFVIQTEIQFTRIIGAWEVGTLNFLKLLYCYVYSIWHSIAQVPYTQTMRSASTVNRLPGNLHCFGPNRLPRGSSRDIRRHPAAYISSERVLFAAASAP